MDRACAVGRMTSIIHTGTVYAVAARETYPNLEVYHYQAFKDPRCQWELDQAVLKKVSAFGRENRIFPVRQRRSFRRAA